MVSRLKLSSKSAYKNSNFNDNITIDAKHNEMINCFKKQKESIPSLKEELKKMIAEYNNKDNGRKNDIDYIIYRDNLREKIYDTKERINTILNEDDINKYYLEVGTLLHSYYENVEISKNSQHNSEKFEENLINYDEYDDIDENDDILSDNEDEDDELEEIEVNNSKNKKKEKEKEKDKKENYKSVLTFFNSREQTENKEEIKNEENINQQEDNDDIKKESVSTKSNSTNIGGYTSMKISDFVKEEARFKKKDILEEYLQKIDPNYISRIKIDTAMYKCPNCKVEMTLYPSDGYQICENCGIQQNIFIESDKPSFKDPPIEVCYFSYKRINHYNESMPLSTIILIV
jgi:DNA-directed RNA polymerase subunit RPC12/RpoP